MRVLIVGPGAMGTLFGVLLAEAGNQVWMLDHRPERARLLSEKGFAVKGAVGERRRKLPVVTDPSDVPAPDFTFIWVKSYDTERAVERLSTALPRDSCIVTLQNGLGNIEAISEYFDRGSLVAGVTSHGATLLGPGEAFHAGEGETAVGALEEGARELAVRCAQMLNKAGIRTRVADDVTSEIWGKLVINAAINPLTAIAGLRNGELLEFEEMKELMGMIVGEAVEVASKLGIKLPFDDPLERVLEVCRLTAPNRSSMLQDVEAGRKTEIDAINGAIAMLGEKLGIPTPVNRTLTHIVRTMSSKSVRKGEAR